MIKENYIEKGHNYLGSSLLFTFPSEESIKQTKDLSQV